MHSKIQKIIFIIFLFWLNLLYGEDTFNFGLQKTDILQDNQIAISFGDIAFITDFFITNTKGKILFPDRNIKPVRQETIEGIKISWQNEEITVKLDIGAEISLFEWEAKTEVIAGFCIKDSAVNGKPIRIKDTLNSTKDDTLSFDKAFPDPDRTGLLSLEFFEEKQILLGISSKQPFSFKDYRKQKGYANKWLISTDKPDLKGQIVISFKEGKKSTFFAVDIRKSCNMGFRDEYANDGKGGWSDDGPDNDLKNLPAGIKVFNNIPFDVIDPSLNNGRSCIVLKGNKQHGENFPELVSIPVDSISAEKVYILHGTTWTPSSYNGPVALYRFIYNDGSFDEFEVVNNRDIIDWWFAPQKEKLENFVIAWEGSSGERWVGLGISSFNLTKNIPVIRIEIKKPVISEDIPAIPGIIGITFSKADIPVLPKSKTIIYPSAPPCNILVYGAGNLRETFDEMLNLKGLKIDEFSGVSKDASVIIIGKGLSKTYLTGIDDFVKNGGGLLVALPPEDAITIYLKDILPVDIADGKTIKVDKRTLIRPEVMDENHPAISGIDWKPYPGSPVYYKVKAKEGTEILIRWSDGSPALTVWNVGAGKVAYFSAPLRTDFGQIYLSSEFHDYWLLLIRLSYWLSGNKEYAETLGFAGKSQRERDRLMDRLAYIRTLSEDIMSLSNMEGKDEYKEEVLSTIKTLYSSLERADTLLANALFKEAYNTYTSILKEIDSIEERYKRMCGTLKETLLHKGFKNFEVKKGTPVHWGQHGILQYSNTEETNNSAIREYTIGVYLDTIQKLGMNTFVQGGGTNRFIRKGADPSTVEETDLQLDIYDDYIREAKKRGMSFYIHLDSRESIHDNFDGNYDYLHQGFIDKLPYPEKRGRAKGAEAHPFNRYNQEVLKRYNSILKIIAQRYRDEPVVAGYNTDNETHNLYWKTEEAREQFQKWLINKYGSLEKINKTLGYNFSSPEQINIPEENKVKEEKLASSPIKALWYEWKDFENWVSWRFFYQYKDAIKGISPEKKLMDRFSPNYAIGHGTYNPYGDIPYDEITSLHDITGLHIGRDFNLDYMTGYAGNAELGLSEYYPLVWDGPYKASFRLLPGLGGPWAVPEMKDEIDNYAAYTRNFWLVFSRDVRVILDHAMGNGSNFLPDELSHSNPYGFGYFRYGVYGMKWVNNIYTNIRGEIDGSIPVLPAAIMEPNESRIQTIASPIEDDLGLLPRESNAIYNTLCRPLLLTPDIIPTSKDISKYKVIIVPYALYIKEETQKKLEEFVKEGGILLATGPLGLYNELSYPSMLLLKNLWGISNVIREDMASGKIKFCDGTELPSPNINKRWLFEGIAKPDTKVIARYSDGKPAILEGVYGKGKAFIISWPFRSSSNPEDILQKTILPYLPELFKCSQTEVYIYPRKKDNDLILFVVNRLFERQNITVSFPKNSEIIDLRLGISWESDTIKCDMLPGEGRVFKIKDYFLKK